MAYRKQKYTKKRTYRKSKKSYRPKRKSYRRTKKLSITRQPFPMSKFVKLRYCENVVMDATTGGVPSTYLFSANRLDLPNYTGSLANPVVGHQPMFYDEMMAQYNNWIVLGSKITVKFFSELGESVDMSCIGISINDNTTLSPSNISAIMENPRQTKYRISRLSDSGNLKGVPVTQTFSMKKFFGITDPKDNQGEYGYNSNSGLLSKVQNQAWFILFHGHPDETTDLGAISAQVTVDYIVRFSEPKDPTQS